MRLRPFALKFLRKVRNKDHLIILEPGFCVACAAALLIIPWQWICAWLLASTIHELCHYWMARICGCRIWQIIISHSGMRMKVDFLTPREELLCALAGPAGSVSLLLMSRWIPRTAVCGLIQFLYNLTPIYPLDGGRTVKSLLEFFWPEKADAILSITGNGILAILLVIGGYMTFGRDMGILPIAAALMLWVKTKKPCKERLMQVQ